MAAELKVQKVLNKAVDKAKDLARSGLGLGLGLGLEMSDTLTLTLT